MSRFSPSAVRAAKRFLSSSGSMAAVSVTLLPKSERANDAHHGKGKFVNPWPSFRAHGFTDMVAVRTAVLERSVSSH